MSQSTAAEQRRLKDSDVSPRCAATITCVPVADAMTAVTYSVRSSPARRPRPRFPWFSLLWESLTLRGNRSRIPELHHFVVAGMFPSTATSAGCNRVAPRLFDSRGLRPRIKRAALVLDQASSSADAIPVTATGGPAGRSCHAKSVLVSDFAGHVESGCCSESSPSRPKK